VHRLPPQGDHGQSVGGKEVAMEITMDRRWSYSQVSVEDIKPLYIYIYIYVYIYIKIHTYYI